MDARHREQIGDMLGVVDFIEEILLVRIHIHACDEEIFGSDRHALLLYSRVTICLERPRASIHSSVLANSLASNGVNTIRWLAVVRRSSMRGLSLLLWPRNTSYVQEALTHFSRPCYPASTPSTRTTPLTIRDSRRSARPISARMLYASEPGLEAGCPIFTGI